MAEEKKGPGRPSLYSEALVDEICIRLIMGDSLNTICKEEAFPAIRTVLEWLVKESDFRDEFRIKYAQAREMQAEFQADGLNDIADDGSNDWMEKRDKDGALIGWQLNGEAVARSKLRLEQRRWNAEKLRPKRYGNKVDITSGDKPISTDLSDAGAKIAALLAVAKQRKEGGE